MTAINQIVLAPCLRLSAGFCAAALMLLASAARADDISSVGWRKIEIAIPMDGHGMKAAGILTTPVEPDHGKSELTFPGTIVIPQHQLRVVAAPAGGLVEAMLVQADEPVTAGQPVARVRSPDLVEAQRHYLGALSDEALSSDKLRRASLLFEGKALPEKELRIAESEFGTAKTKLDERMQILFLMGMDRDDFETLRTTRGIVSTLTVKSPINGTVVTRQAGAGEQVKSAAPLYTIGELDPLWVNIQIPAHRLGTIAVNAHVSLPAYGIEGKIIRIGRSIDQSTQSTMAVAQVSGNGGSLRPGLAVSAAVRLEQGGPIVAGKSWSVPSSSVVRHRDLSWVFMRSKDGFRARPVQVINESARTVAIRADFNAKDEVAARGVLALLSELVDADKDE